jgi:two-component system response regulator NreC
MNSNTPVIKVDIIRFNHYLNYINLSLEENSMNNRYITVLIADDHCLAREGIRSILSRAHDIKIVGEAEEGEEIRQKVVALRPQVLLLDLQMPNLSPAQLEKWVRTNYPETTTLVLTGHDRKAYGSSRLLTDMMDAGVSGYLDKNLRGEQLIASIRRVAHGEMLFSPEQIERARRWREEILW